MTAILYYWRGDNYARDAQFGFGYHLSQNSPLLTALTRGDHIFAFTRRARDKMYVMACDLVVGAVTRNAPTYRYGRYRVWGDLDATRYFNPDSAPNAEPLIRALGVSTSAAILAQSFQGLRAVKSLGDNDAALLARFCADLAVLPPVSIYGEDEWEARLLLGDQALDRVRQRDEAASVRTAYLFERVERTRARRHATRLQDLYAGRCQICLYDPMDRYGRSLCHGHHIVWLCRGGEDALENMLLLCPNHHAAVHQADAPFDYATLAYQFHNGLIEAVQANLHLALAV